MVKETENHALNKYDKGDANWNHSPDMQHIEERLVVRDEESRLNDYIPHDTATFIATDSGAVYDGDGTQWSKAQRDVGSLSTDRVGNATYYVRDSDSLQSVVNAAPPEADIKPLNPDTTFDVATLEITTDGVTLSDFNLRTADGTDDVLLYIHACTDVTVESCDLDGNDANNSDPDGFGGGTTNGIEVIDASDITIRDNYVHDVVSHGILATSRSRDSSKSTGPINSIRLIDNKVENTGNGGVMLRGGGGLAAEWGWIQDNEVRNCVGEYLQAIDGWQHARITNNQVEDGGGAGDAVALEQHTGRGVDRALKDILVAENSGTTPSSGVASQYNAAPYENITITDNDFTGPGPSESSTRGVYFRPIDNPRHIKVTDNTLVGFERGIFIDDAQCEMTVTDNQIRDVNRALVIQQGDGASIAQNHCSEVVGDTVVYIKTDVAATDGHKLTENHFASTTGGCDGVTVDEEGGTYDNYVYKNNTITVPGTGIVNNATGSNGITKDNQIY